VKVTDAEFTFVAVNDDGRPRPVITGGTEEDPHDEPSRIMTPYFEVNFSWFHECSRPA